MRAATTAGLLLAPNVLASAAPTGPAWLGQSPVGRDAAREAARNELSKGIYHADDPGLFERVLRYVVEWVDARLNDAAGVAPGGGWGLLALLVALAALVLFILWQTGPVRRTASHAHVVELSGPLDAAEHRRRADRYAAAGRYAEAIRERMRAIVRELESRGVLEPRLGRTADEVARDAGRLVPSIAADLMGATRTFDEVWFGGRAATALADAAMRDADERVRSTRLVVQVPSATQPVRYQMPQ